jgi:hypothetical protein
MRILPIDVVFLEIYRVTDNLESVFTLHFNVMINLPRSTWMRPAARGVNVEHGHFYAWLKRIDMNECMALS